MGNEAFEKKVKVLGLTDFNGKNFIDNEKEFLNAQQLQTIKTIVES